MSRGYKDFAPTELIGRGAAAFARPSRGYDHIFSTGQIPDERELVPTVLRESASICGCSVLSLAGGYLAGVTL